MEKAIKIIIVFIAGIVVLAIAIAVFVSNVWQARDRIDWQPADYQNAVEVEMPGKQEKNELEGKVWAWKETVFNNDTKQVPENFGDFTVTFSEGGNFSATTDCNNAMGKVGIDQNQISFESAMAMTKMACAENSQQDEFLGQLKETASYFVNEQGQLILELPFGTGSMVFEPVLP